VAVGVDASGAKPRGLIVLESHHCTTCHSLDGSVTVGPTFKGRFGTSDVVEVGGAERTVTLDETYSSTVGVGKEALFRSTAMERNLGFQRWPGTMSGSPLWGTRRRPVVGD